MISKEKNYKYTWLNVILFTIYIILNIVLGKSMAFTHWLDKFSKSHNISSILVIFLFELFITITLFAHLNKVEVVVRTVLKIVSSILTILLLLNTIFLGSLTMVGFQEDYY